MSFSMDLRADTNLRITGVREDEECSLILGDDRNGRRILSFP
jgi:hypothetical protein